jgi:hypothetical protein
VTKPDGLAFGMGISGSMSGMGSGREKLLEMNGESTRVSVIRYLVASFSRYFASRRLIRWAVARKANSSSKLPGALSGML